MRWGIAFSTVLRTRILRSTPKITVIGMYRIPETSRLSTKSPFLNTPYTKRDTIRLSIKLYRILFKLIPLLHVKSMWFRSETVAWKEWGSLLVSWKLYHVKKQHEYHHLGHVISLSNPSRSTAVGPNAHWSYIDTKFVLCVDHVTSRAPPVTWLWSARVAQTARSLEIICACWLLCLHEKVRRGG